MGGSAAKGEAGPRKGEARRKERGRAQGGRSGAKGAGRARGKRLHPLRRYVLLWSQGGVSNVLPNRPPFFCGPITGHNSPQTRELDVEDGVGFRAERAKDFCGGDVRGDILRQDRHKRGIGIGDGRKRAVFGGFGQAERAAEPPRGTGIGGGNPSEPPCEPHPSGGGAACGAPLAAARFQPSGARNRFWRLVISPRQRLRAGQIAQNIIAEPPDRPYIHRVG